MDKNRIEEGIYQGYVWKSNQPEPEVYNEEFFKGDALEPTENPFIIEAQLYNENVSYSVKYADGQYWVKCYSASDMEKKAGEETKMHFYFPNRMKKIEGKLLQFCQFWKEEEDDLNLGMKSLQPDKLVFMGFIDKDKEERK